MSKFNKLKAKLAKKGASSPAGLAAYIGRKKYGSKKFAAMGAAGRHKSPNKKASRGGY